MSAFYDLADRALLESFEIIGENFQWKTKSYPCSIDHKAHVLTTRKALFSFENADSTVRVYPKRGESIVVSGKSYQVTKLSNAAMRAVAGGTTEDQPFVDDPGDPSIDIEYDKFIKGKR